MTSSKSSNTEYFNKTTSSHFSSYQLVNLSVPPYVLTCKYNATSQGLIRQLIPSAQCPQGKLQSGRDESRAVREEGDTQPPRLANQPWQSEG